MKLLIVHNIYQTNNIGGEDFVYKNELRLLQNRLGDNNVLFYEVSNSEINKVKLLFDIWFSFKHYRRIQKIIKEHSIDIVHVHNFFPLLTPGVFKAAKNSGAKVIHTMHNYRLWCIAGIFYRDGHGICEKCVEKNFSFSGIFNKCYRHSLIQSAVAQMAFWFYRVTKAFAQIDYFFVLTDFQKEKVKSLGIDESKIILKPNSISFNVKSRHDQKKHYLFVGRLEEAKGIDLLLDVWEKLDNRFVLTIIGGGDRENILKRKYAKENIIFRGKCSREETRNSIASSKYLIQPSIWYETFGLTIIEAMSCGVPVIGLDIGTRRDFIQDGFNGFLCDRHHLKSVLEKSYDYPHYEQLSNNARKTAKEYQNEVVLDKQIEIYQKIMENKL